MTDYNCLRQSLSQAGLNVEHCALLGQACTDHKHSPDETGYERGEKKEDGLGGLAGVSATEQVEHQPSQAELQQPGGRSLHRPASLRHVHLVPAQTHSKTQSNNAE